jgi:CPA2 family monovalent cation:H+ antiporter-2
MHSPGIVFLQEIIIVLALSVLVILVFQRVKLPIIIGFLITGIIAGPTGLSLIKASSEVELLSEIGVILLLFLIGLEFSLSSLNAIRRTVFLGGSIQVGLVTVACVLTWIFLGQATNEGLFFGFLFALSSTAIVLKLLQDNGQINSPHGKMAVAILIYQDIMVVPMMLFTPMLAGKTDDMLGSVLMLILKIVAVLALVWLMARYLVPRLLYQVAASKSRELFLLTILGLCFSVAFLTSYVGLSLALGAFLAGLIISESEYSHQATNNILPFREVFTSLFFISIGMLVDIHFLIDHFFVIIGITLIVVLGKWMAGAVAAFLLGYPSRTTFMVAFTLFQVGEFSFILSKVGLEMQLINVEQYQYFLAVSVLTMGLTPFVMNSSERLCTYLGLQAISKHMDKRRFASKAVEAIGEPGEETDLKDHLVIIGFGVNGQNMAKAAKVSGIPYVIIELNAERVKKFKKSGEPILFGDAVHIHILEHVKVYAARVAVIAISDPEATKKIISSIREICRTVYIISRTRFVKEVEENLRLGANEVVPEELETSVEVFSRVLYKYLIPANEIEKVVYHIRSEGLSMVRPLQKRDAHQKPLDIPDVTTLSLSVADDIPWASHQTLEQLRLRERFGLTVLAIGRQNEYLTNLNKDTKLMPEDLVYLFGKQQDMIKLNQFITSKGT